jgi:hypothetical protein
MTAIALLKSFHLARGHSMARWRLKLPALIEAHVCAPPHGSWQEIHSDEFRKGRVGMYQCPECEQCFAAGHRE